MIIISAALAVSTSAGKFSVFPWAQAISRNAKDNKLKILFIGLETTSSL
jgi:hypothetical protein